MGVCLCKAELISPNKDEFSRNYQNDKLRIITQEVDSIFNEFKNTILLEMLKLFPCTSADFERAFMTIYTKHEEILLDSCHKKRLTNTDSARAVKLFRIKSKAQEGYIRYSNDFSSLKFTHNTKKNLLEQYFNTGASSKDIINLYYKIGTGTYFLQGSEELKEILLANPNEMFEILEKQFQSNKHKLKELYHDLVVSNIIDIEIYTKTIEDTNKQLNEL